MSDSDSLEEMEVRRKRTGDLTEVEERTRKVEGTSRDKRNDHCIPLID
jgi:hypothetical protein